MVSKRSSDSLRKPYESRRRTLTVVKSCPGNPHTVALLSSCFVMSTPETTKRARLIHNPSTIYYIHPSEHAVD
ncbi:unnamed protein product [Cuscuta campestris]|uniref:Uncharacterized protein n=1 Tax=Cuscuta campestris TaxID=132261 RepID=A0A484LTZ8_9ASTE|nr:unnamed protein product [Cuscuta campestris]